MDDLDEKSITVAIQDLKNAVSTLSNKPIKSKDSWRETNHWIKRGSTFSVEIMHWTREKLDFSAGNVEISVDVSHQWNVYLYVYPKFPLFDLFNNCKDANSLAVGELFHGGITLFEKTYKTIKIGCDYSHYRDDMYLESAPLFDGKHFQPNRSVLCDAEQLFSWAKEREGV